MYKYSRPAAAAAVQCSTKYTASRPFSRFFLTHLASYRMVLDSGGGVVHADKIREVDTKMGGGDFNQCLFMQLVFMVWDAEVSGVYFRGECLIRDIRHSPFLIIFIILGGVSNKGYQTLPIEYFQWGSV